MKKEDGKVKKRFYIVAAILAACYMIHPSGRSERDIRNHVVRLTNERGNSCSGESVKAASGTTYILTAGHCRILEKDGKIHVITEDGRQMDRAIIAEDPTSDLLLLEGVPGAKGLDIARTQFKNSKVRTFTHGNRLDTYKTEGEIIMEQEVKAPLRIIESEEDAAKCASMPKQKVENIDLGFFQLPACFLDVPEMVTTALIVPGSSGGAVVDKHGDLVGVASAGDGTFGYLVRLVDIQKFLNNY